jgi:signal transduction histidine kinase
MENFLDEYQLVRLLFVLGGLLVMAVQLLLEGWDDRVGPATVILLVVAAHAAWCRVSHIRTPRIMLGLDITMSGWLMVIYSEGAAITTASFAVVTLITVLFSSGWWTVGLLAYLATWYVTSFILREGMSAVAIGDSVAVIFTVSAVAVVMSRVRSWLGRLDANRSQMLGTVSHELRNNLTGMIGMTHLVGSEDLEPAEVSELISLAHLQALDAAEIVEDLLTATRLERSALQVEMVAVDVNAEIETTVRRFAGEGLQVSLNLSEELPSAEGDALRVRQVLRNLLSNAERYGGSNVTIQSKRVEDNIELIVGDDGDGVPVEEESTIFLPYRRSSATRRHAGSVGLGLWICRQLAHAMGGDLEYRRVAERTEFVVSLGLHADEPPVEGASSEKLGATFRESLSRIGDLVTRRAMFGGAPLGDSSGRV